MEMNLNPEEIQKINNLWKTSRFQRSWRAVQNIINCKDNVTNYFVRNIILIFISVIVGIGFFFLEEQGILPDSVLIDKLMKFIVRLILFLIALQIGKKSKEANCVYFTRVKSLNRYYKPFILQQKLTQNMIFLRVM